MTEQKIKVIYIAGSGRSGSTLLSQLLGEMEGVVNIGEAPRYLYNNRLFSQDIPCSCGKPFESCEFWQGITGSADPEIRAMGTRLVRMRYIPLLASPFRPGRFSGEFARFSAAMGDLFAAIVAQTGSRVIVDASKNPANGFLLTQMPHLEVYVVHLVRDARGYVSSWSKPKGYLKRFPALTVLRWWLSYNIFSEALKAYAAGYLLVRYEDFARNPRQVLNRIAAFAGEDMDTLQFLQDNQARVGVQHMLGSNPDKLKNTGPFEIQVHKWQLPRLKHFLVTLLTWPLLSRYRYL